MTTRQRKRQRPTARDRRAAGQETTEPAQRFDDPPPHELEKGIQATRHCCHTPVSEPDRLDRNSLAILCGEAVGQLWRSVA